MDEPGDAPVNAITTAAADNVYAKLVTRYVVPVLMAGFLALGHFWFSHINDTLAEHGRSFEASRVAIEAISRVNGETHQQLKEFRAETARAETATVAAREQTSLRLELIEKQIREIEPRVKEIEQKVKGQ